jgi:hypothetical protein
MAVSPTGIPGELKRESAVPRPEHAALAILDDELDEMFARMQTPEFLEAAERAFNMQPRMRLETSIT